MAYLPASVVQSSIGLPPGRGLVFRSFWMGGYEGADHVNSHGVPLQIQLSNGHAQCYELDYAAAARIGLRTVRESVGWRSSTRSNGKLDLPRLQRMADAAERQGVQVILTLHHYGLPPGMDFYASDFAPRFADFCDQVARALHGRSNQAPLFQPVNEISFLSWAVGHTNLMHPYVGESAECGYELKCQLVQAALQRCDALWASAPDARIVHTDPLIHVAPDDELVSRQSSIGDQLAAGIDGMNLDDVFCQISANSCNLIHGTSPLKGCRLTSANQSWHLMPLPQSGSPFVFGESCSNNRGHF